MDELDDECSLQMRTTLALLALATACAPAVPGMPRQPVHPLQSPLQSSAPAADGCAERPAMAIAPSPPDAGAAATAPRRPRLIYPPARQVDHVDVYHGVAVPDPYRWLEDLDSAETRAWVAAENRLTFACLDGIAARPAIRRRLTELWNYEKYGLPTRAGATSSPRTTACRTRARSTPWSAWTARPSC